MTTPITVSGLTIDSPRFYVPGPDRIRWFPWPRRVQTLREVSMAEWLAHPITTVAGIKASQPEAP